MVRRLDTTMSLVILEGPEEAASAAMELVGGLHTWTNTLSLAVAIETGTFVPTPDVPRVTMEDLFAHQESSYQASDAFILLCRHLLDT